MIVSSVATVTNVLVRMLDRGTLDLAMRAGPDIDSNGWRAMML